jgi:hypothetical protein
MYRGVMYSDKIVWFNAHVANQQLNKQTAASITKTTENE